MPSDTQKCKLQLKTIMVFLATKIAVTNDYKIAYSAIVNNYTDLSDKTASNFLNNRTKINSYDRKLVFIIRNRFTRADISKIIVK